MSFVCYFPCQTSNVIPAMWELAPQSLLCFLLLCSCLETPVLEQRDPGDAQEGVPALWKLTLHLEMGQYNKPGQSELVRAEECFCTYRTLSNPFLSLSPSHV